MDFRQLFIALQIKSSRFVVEYFFWITFTLISLLFFIVGYFVIFPRYALFVGQKNIELPILQKQNSEVIERLDRIENDGVDIEKIKDNKELKKLLEILPDKKDLVVLFQEFDAIVKKEGFRVINFSITENSRVNQRAVFESGTVRPLQIQLSLAGAGYEALKSLIMKLEKELRLMDINSLSFIPNYDGATIYNFMITTYYIE